MSSHTRIQGYVEDPSKDVLDDAVEVLEPWIESEDTIHVIEDKLRIEIEPDLYRNLGRFIYKTDPYDFEMVENSDGVQEVKYGDNAGGGFVQGAESYYMIEVSTDGEFTGFVHSSQEDVNPVKLTQWGTEVIGEPPNFERYEEYVRWQTAVENQFIEKHK